MGGRGSGRRKSNDIDYGAIVVMCPHCGYQWATYSTSKYVKCPKCGKYFKNPLYVVLGENYEKKLNASKGKLIYKILTTEELLPVKTLIEKGIISKNIYQILKQMEKEGKIKLLRAFGRVFIPASELPKIIKYGEPPEEEEELEETREEDTGQGLRLPAP